MKLNNIHVFVIIALLTSVIGCSGGGGGSSPTERPEGRVEGKAVDAILIDSTIRAYEWKDGIKIPGVIDETVTDSNGDYFLLPRYKDAYFLLEATSGYYIEEATGTRVNLADDQKLTALVRFESGSSIVTNITLATHQAVCRAEWSALTQGNNDADAVDLSNDLFSVVTGVPIRETTPLNITDGNNASPVVTAGLQYGLYSAAWSSLSEKMAVASSLEPHKLTSTTSIHLAQIACNDIRADGMLDGKGYTPATPETISQLSFGTVELKPETYKNELAQEMLTIAASSVNKTGLTANDFFSVADSLSKMDSPLFNNIAPVSADLTGPEITLDIPENTFINNTKLFDFSVTDPLGIKTLDYYVNGDFIASGTAGDTALNIDTTGYADGLYEVKVIASDPADNSSTFTRNFNFSNDTPIVELTTSLLTNNQTYLASGTYQISGSPVSTITINGVSAEIDTANLTWSATIPLLSGNNTVTMNITDDIGNIGSNQKTVGVDLNKPVVNVNTTQITFTTFQGQLNLCTNGVLDQDTASGTPICLSTDNVSLNGTTIAAGIQSQGFALLSYSPVDPQAAGVFTSTSDLTIDYKFSQDGNVKVDWSPVPTNTNWGATYYFPLVTEYLGDTWYQISNETNNKIEIRVTDLAGNSQIQAWNILIDVLIPNITVTSNTSNKSLITNTVFDNRFSVDGQLINVEYELNNPSSTAYYISMDDAQAHGVSHTYENRIRKNRSRLNTNTEWRTRYMICTVSGGQFYIVTCTTQDGYSSLTSYNDYTNSIDFNVVNLPAAVNGAWTDYQQEIIPTSTGQWVQQAPCAYRITGNDKIVCSSGTAGGMRNLLEVRTYETAEYEPGYPRNESTNTVVTSVMTTERVSVFNDSLGQEISPVSTWYRVPPKTTIKIIKSIRTPVIQHFNDLSVIDAGFSSYTTKSLDSSTTWTIDTDLEITRAIDPGDVALLSSVTQSVETYGNGTESYTVTR